MTTFHQLTATSLGGQLISMADYAGKLVVVVNTASHCGFTPQYAGLDALYKKYAAQGLMVLGFPCNQFGKQEPGGADEIAQTCHINYGVSFPMFEKVEGDPDPKSCSIQKQNSCMINTPLSGSCVMSVIRCEFKRSMQCYS